MCMTPSDDLVARLADSLHVYLQNNPPDPTRWDSYAHQLEAFPLGADIYAAWFVRPSGEVLVWSFLDSDDDYDHIRPEPHAWMRHFAIREGTKHFPDLIELLPTRPFESVDCPTCQGVGFTLRTHKNDPPSPWPCRLCDSLGWVEPAS